MTSSDGTYTEESTVTSVESCSEESSVFSVESLLTNQDDVYIDEDVLAYGNSVDYFPRQEEKKKEKRKRDEETEIVNEPILEKENLVFSQASSHLSQSSKELFKIVQEFALKHPKTTKRLTAELKSPLPFTRQLSEVQVAVEHMPQDDIVVVDKNLEMKLANHDWNQNPCFKFVYQDLNLCIQKQSDTDRTFLFILDDALGNLYRYKDGGLVNMGFFKDKLRKYVLTSLDNKKYMEFTKDYKKMFIDKTQKEFKNTPKQFMNDLREVLNTRSTKEHLEKRNKRLNKLDIFLNFDLNTYPFKNIIESLVAVCRNNNNLLNREKTKKAKESNAQYKKPEDHPNIITLKNLSKKNECPLEFSNIEFVNGCNGFDDQECCQNKPNELKMKENGKEQRKICRECSVTKYGFDVEEMIAKDNGKRKMIWLAKCNGTSLFECKFRANEGKNGTVVDKKGVCVDCKRKWIELTSTTKAEYMKVSKTEKNSFIKWIENNTAATSIPFNNFRQPFPQDVFIKAVPEDEKQAFDWESDMCLPEKPIHELYKRQHTIPWCKICGSYECKNIGNRTTANNFFKIICCADWGKVVQSRKVVNWRISESYEANRSRFARQKKQLIPLDMDFLENEAKDLYIFFFKRSSWYPLYYQKAKKEVVDDDEMKESKKEDLPETYEQVKVNFKEMHMVANIYLNSNKCTFSFESLQFIDRRYYSIGKASSLPKVRRTLVNGNFSSYEQLFLDIKTCFGGMPATSQIVIWMNNPIDFTLYPTWVINELSSFEKEGVDLKRVYFICSGTSSDNQGLGPIVCRLDLLRDWLRHRVYPRADGTDYEKFAFGLEYGWVCLRELEKKCRSFITHELLLKMQREI